MAAGPTVVATITAQDLASPVIQRLLAEAQKATATSGAAASRSSAEALARMEGLSSHMGRFGGALSEAAAGAFAAFGAHAIRHIVEVGGEMERVQRRMLSFTNTTTAQMAALRRQADTTFSGLRGGPQGFLEGARAAAMSGVRPESAADVARYGAVFADETGADNAEATEKLVQHTAMMGHLRDESGKQISFAAATREQVERATRETMNMLIAVNKIAPGNINQVYEGFKFAGPVALGLGRDANETAALYTVLAEHGIAGAEAGNAIKSAESMILSPPAKARQAIATAGLNYSDYVKADTTLPASSIEKGVEMRLGTLDKATKAGIERAVAAFKSDKDLDHLNRSLTDVFKSSGVKTVDSMVKAGNLARDVTKLFTTTADLPKFLRDLQAKGLGVGFLNAILGTEIGGRFAAVSGQEVIDKTALYKEETAKDNIGDAMRERERSYDGRLSALSGSLTGLRDQLFLPMKAPLGEAYDVGAMVARSIAGASPAIHTAIDAALVGGTIAGSLKTAGTLARGAEAVGRWMGAIEGEAPLILRAATGLAALEFAPVAAGIAGVALAIEAFQHRVEVADALKSGAHQLHNYFTGDVDEPATSEDFDRLRADRDAKLAQLRDRERNRDRMEPSDPQLDALKADRLSKLADLSITVDDAPDVSEAKSRLDEARAARVSRDDPVLSDLRRRLATAQRDASRPAPPDTPEQAHFRGVIDQLDKVDPDVLARDDRIARAREERRALIPRIGEDAPDVLALDREIDERHRANVAARQAMIDKGRATINEQKHFDPAGAKVSAESLTEAMGERERELQAQLAKSVADAQAAYTEARRQAEAKLPDRPEIRALDARIDARREEANRQVAPDPVTEDLRGALDRANRAIDSFVRRPVRPPADFLSPDLAPEGRVSLALPRLPLQATGGRAVNFDLLGAVPEPLAGTGGRPIALPSLAMPTPALPPIIAPGSGAGEKALPPINARVDVGPLKGDVKGEVDVHQSISLTVEPSQYFVGLTRQVDGALKRITVVGGVSGQGSTETMGGMNGVAPAAPAHMGHQ